MNFSKIAGCILIILTLSFQTQLSAQKTKATLTFKDGTIKKGLGKLSGHDKVKFKKNKKDKATKYQFSNLEKVAIQEGEELATYVYIKVDLDTYKVLKELSVGEVNLYTMEVTGYTGPVYMAGGPGGGTWVGVGNSYNIKNLFVLRQGEEIATHLGSNQLFTKNFKKAASEYFKDCPFLVNKIMDREFKKRDIKEIVNFYNEECQAIEAK